MELDSEETPLEFMTQALSKIGMIIYLFIYQNSKNNWVKLD